MVDTHQPWLERALAVLTEGGVVAVPTESFFALAVDATRADALDKLFVLKNRDLGKGIGLMVPSVGWRECVNNVPAIAERLAATFWPGPLSMVLPAANALDPRLVVNGCVSLRVAGPSRAAELVEAFGKPLTATSANRPGRPPCRRPCEVAAELSGAGLHIVEGECPGGLVSTLIRITQDGWTMLRPGAVSSEGLRAVLDEPERC